MTCSRFTSWSLPTEIDPKSTFNVVMSLIGEACSDFPNPDVIFSGIADVDVNPNSFRGWITRDAAGQPVPVDPGWVHTYNQILVFKDFYQDLTGLTDIPDVLHWKLATGPADPATGVFTATDSTETVTIPVLKPGMGMLPWIALGAAAIGVSAVGIVAYTKRSPTPTPYRR